MYNKYYASSCCFLFTANYYNMYTVQCEVCWTCFPYISVKFLIFKIYVFRLLTSEFSDEIPCEHCRMLLHKPDTVGQGDYSDMYCRFFPNLCDNQVFLANCLMLSWKRHINMACHAPCTEIYLFKNCSENIWVYLRQSVFWGFEP